MADAKISALPASTTPLAGTEVVPLVQSGVTKKVAVSDLTAGRSVASAQLTATSTTDSGVVSRGWSPGGGANNSNGSLQVGGNAAFCGRFSWDATGATAGTVFLDNTTNDSGTRIQSRLRTDGSAVIGWTLQVTGGVADLTVNTGNLIIGTAGKGVTLPGGITWTSGSGSPEGVVTAPVGSLFSRTDGGAGTSLYVKQSGSGNTGWVGK
jgi:hypothetical protein